MGRAQPQPSLVKSPNSLLPLCMCRPVKLLKQARTPWSKALKLSSWAAGGVHRMLWTSRQWPPLERSKRRPSCGSSRPLMASRSWDAAFPLCCVRSDKSILTHCSPEKFEVGLDPALALAICEQSRRKVSRQGWVASRTEADDFRLVQVEMQPKIR